MSQTNEQVVNIDDNQDRVEQSIESNNTTLKVRKVRSDKGVPRGSYNMTTTERKTRSDKGMKRETKYKSGEERKVRYDKGIKRGSFTLAGELRKKRSDAGQKRGAYKQQEFYSSKISVTLNKTEWAILASLAPDGKAQKEAVRYIRAYLATLDTTAILSAPVEEAKAI